MLWADDPVGEGGTTGKVVDANPEEKRFKMVGHDEGYLESTTVETGHLVEGDGCARERRGKEGLVQGWGR